VKLSKRNSSLVATAIAAALLMTACGSDEGGEEGSAPEGGGSFSIYIGEPENPLIPGNTSETEGGQVVDSIWTGLVQYDHKTNEPAFTGVAESIESDDATNWTVTLKDGWTFHDGTPVNAESFVNAWNYIAYSPNAQGNSYFFNDIASYADLQAPTDAEGNPTGDPAVTEMSGLKVVDDLSFTVELSSPYAQWPTKVGYTAFFPMPQAFFDDPAAFGEQPIGNGPFKADEPFVPGQGITLTRFDDYAGEDKDTLPPDAISSAKDEFGDRYIETVQGDITSLGFPTYDPRFADPQVRRAFSMAIDREAITKAIFDGTRTPATSFLNPVINGYRDDACDACELNVEEANRMLDEAGFDRSQPVDLWFNGGAGHDAWMEAIGNQLRDNLKVDYVLRGELDFSEYLPLRDAKGMTGPFRDGWIMDYPTAENFLGPLYTTAALPPAGSNNSFYSNPEFDALVTKGNAASNDEEAIAAYQAAEDILVRDMPEAPLWYRLNQGAHSEKVDNVIIDAFGRIDAAAVKVVG
jgi:oligopeptide transport system substrate-binding protein